MPWWAVGYLVMFLLLTFGGIWDDLQRPDRIWFISGEMLSACFVCLFMLGYFEPSIGAALGASVFPMIVIGIVHECMAAKRTIESGLADSSGSDRESAVLTRAGLLLGAVFIAPGYLFGLLLGLRNLGF